MSRHRPPLPRPATSEPTLPAHAGAQRLVAIAAFAVSVVLMVLATGATLLVVGQPLTAELVAFPVAFLTFGGIGLIVVVRQPGNRVGRLALLTGLLGAVAAIADTHARLPGAVAGQDWSAWLASVTFPLSLGPMLALFLLFPDGRLRGPIHRLVVGLTLAGVALLAVGNAFTPAFADHPTQTNPLAVPAFTGSPLEQGGVGWFLVLFGAVAAAAGLVLRLRRASGLERQQLKWVTSAVAVHGAAWVLLALELPVVGAVLGQTLVFVTLALVPMATGIAILRHRLYDIDVVIRRTALYGLVVTVLAVVYAGSALALQAVLSPATDGDAVPVALSTLLTAMLFSPIRARIRAGLDRRFFRAGYDAELVLGDVRERIRDEVDLPTVVRLVEEAAGRTVQPARCGLWLR